MFAKRKRVSSKRMRSERFLWIANCNKNKENYFFLTHYNCAAVLWYLSIWVVSCTYLE